ncbi:MAG: hypothetical protein HY735_08550 [Verrucomicrobia bacterium]|nr:hypothetical protein [Verrucomicrobiota bacterium]
MKTKPFLPLACFITILIAFPITLFSAEADKAASLNVSGLWKWSVTTQDGQSFDSSVALKQEAEKLTGTYKGRLGESAIEDGKFSGSTVSFKVTRKRDDQTFTIKYEGKVEGDRIKGSVVIGDGDRTFEWNAKREPSKLDLTGTWKWSMLRQNGEKMEATMKLKADGEKLTGSIAGGEWTVELENGRVLGDGIAFQTTIERDGQKFVAKSKGKITGDIIKGTVEFLVDGEARTREWEAQRQ